MTSVNSSVDIYIGNVVIGKLANENLVKANWGVVVNTSGTILAAGPKSDILEIYSGHVTYLKPFELLMPGFIDAHLHAPQFGNLGKLVKTVGDIDSDRTLLQIEKSKYQTISNVQ